MLISFQFFVENGYENLAKDIYHTCKIDIHVDNDYAFHLSCREGYVDVAKWLFNIGGDNIDKNDAFELSCRMAQMDVVKWLYNLGVDIHYDDDSAFVSSCESGGRDITKRVTQTW